ncbi:MAG: bifunctional riboflavin kinase/FMN adenylyltransferase [Zetaproteobacteria bacterium]|nr:MAG: bifunctional riboflavin kinase/FMN adenylyltransferase [Zetaproteobacteria bacterium]
MQLFDTYENIPFNAQGCVVIIGNFDGVHKGHQALIDKAHMIAKESQKPLAVLTFEPHPRQLFRPDEPPCRITPQDLKAERLALHNVDYVFSLPFDWDFASQSAQDFIQNILIGGLNASHVIVGHDFKFGQLRKGTPQTIKAAGLPVTIISEVKGENNCNLSSSHVRQLLRHGKIEEANAILGWDWEIRGEIFKGDQRGRELGYPTANMKLNNIVHPAYGIYACLTRIKGENTWMTGAANIGIRPMFEVPIAQVETFIFDFDQEIYGKTLCVRPIKRLRSEAKFNSLDNLIIQMEKDCAQAKDILKDIV